MTLLLSDVARAMEAPDAPPLPVTGWSVDSRTVQPGDLFFALHGPLHDGHKYAGEALEKGAIAAVVQRGAGASACPLLVVENPLKALQELALTARRRWAGTVIAVTGSAGKTTTKDVIAHLLSACKTIGNLNNHVGLPLSILRLPDDCRLAVLEMGMNHAGEIRELARIAEPNVGVVTNVGYAHMESFDSIEAIGLAKRELIEALGPAGTAVLNGDDPLVRKFREIHPGRTITFGLSADADVRAEDIVFEPSLVRFRCGGVDFESPLAGRHGVMNVLAGLAVARIFDVPAHKLQAAVGTLTPGRMRGERLDRGGVIIFNDSYNANPEAVRSMIDLLRETPARRRVAVLGEMLELGRCTEVLHRDVGRYVAERGIDVLVAIRGAACHMADEARRSGMSGGAAYFFEDSASAGDFVRDLVREGDAVLFKGSRAVQMERALERVLA